MDHSWQVAARGPAARTVYGQPSRRRYLAFAASAALHLAALALLLTWREAPQLLPAREALTSIAFPKPPQPPPRPPPEHHKAAKPRAAQAAGNPGKQAKASPVVAKAIPVKLPPVAAPAKPSTGDEARSGAALAGNGPGAGGSGIGPGGGGRGGNGDGVETSAELIDGDITDRDYPHGASARGDQGTVETEVAVGVNGRATGCTVTRSSGSTELDQTTCRLILKRFRFNPGRDRFGRPVPDTVDYDQEWHIRRISAE